MTIQIPDDLAQGLEGMAAAQQKSLEQVALAAGSKGPIATEVEIQAAVEA